MTEVAPQAETPSGEPTDNARPYSVSELAFALKRLPSIAPPQPTFDLMLRGAT